MSKTAPILLTQAGTKFISPQVLEMAADGLVGIRILPKAAFDLRIPAFALGNAKSLQFVILDMRDLVSDSAVHRIETCLAMDQLTAVVVISADLHSLAALPRIFETLPEASPDTAKVFYVHDADTLAMFILTICATWSIHTIEEIKEHYETQYTSVTEDSNTLFDLLTTEVTPFEALVVTDSPSSELKVRMFGVWETRLLI